jgi:transcriptional regulator with PAS, ATPase and Fis domain
MNLSGDGYGLGMVKPKHFENKGVESSESGRRAPLRPLPEMEKLRQEKFVTESRKMRQVFRFIERIAHVPDVTVLIEGETGTGKELISEFLHYGSPRGYGPFVTINSGAIPNNLIESELFGYDRGSFTGALNQGKKGKFEMAHGGTLLLDEISELPLDAQTKLLRVLEERAFYRVGGTRKVEVSVRVIAASNRNLQVAVHNGQFREDLYYRLNVARIAIPPLRERKEDILPIAVFYLEKANQRFGRGFRAISEEAQGVLISHPWRGNVRELRNAIDRVVLAETGPMVEAKHFGFLQSHEMVSQVEASNGFPGRLPEGESFLGSPSRLSSIACRSSVWHDRLR